MKLLIAKPVLILCLLLAVLYGKSQEERPLLHLQKEKTYYLYDTVTSISTQSSRGSEEKVNTRISFRMAFKVAGITDTVYHLEGRYEQLEMRIKLPDTTLEMNSEKYNKTDTPSSIMGELANKQFAIIITRAGKVRSIKNLDYLIISECSNFFPGDSLKKKKVTGQFVQAFGEAACKGLLEMGIAVLPGTPVTTKAKWQTNSSIASPAAALVHTNYQLSDVTGEYYIIAGQGTITSGKDITPIEINGIPAQYSLDGSLMNEIKIDKKNGWVIKAKLKQLIEENIEIPDNPKVPGGMNVPMLFTIEMTIDGRQ